METGAPDILRTERFGSLYFSRRTSTYRFCSPTATAVLLEACRLPPGAPRRWLPPHLFGDVQRALMFLALRRSGVIDAQGHCAARVVSRAMPEAALSAPLKTSVEVTHRCNRQCPHCYLDRSQPSPREQLTLELIDKLFASLRTLGAPYIVVTGGEPLLRPDFFEIAELVAHHHMAARLCTNAEAIDDAVARRLAATSFHSISVSLDGPDAATHDALRGAGSFARLSRGVQAMVRAGVGPIRLRFTLSRLNAITVPRLEETARQLGIERVVVRPFRPNRPADVGSLHYLERCDYERARDLAVASWPDDGVYAEFGGSWPTRGPHLPVYGCPGGNTTAVVAADGSVLPCGSAPGTEHWNLAEHSFEECWLHAPHMHEWRTFAIPDSCRGCPELGSCGGGCRMRAWSLGQGLDGPDLWGCTRPERLLNGP
jgi:mycofactocin biosynthetic radical S-adenosylmethionine protein MftC